MPEFPAADSRITGGRFCTTHWTAVLQAARPDAAGSQEAFARLYLDYWRPLYAYVRRRGHAPAAAEDLAQSFFVRLLEKESLAGLEREGGRFRSFLLGALKHFLANEWDRARAQKRGGGQELLRLDAEEDESQFLARPPADVKTPETVFEKEWAYTLLERVSRQLAEHYAAEGKMGLFEHLRPYVQGDQNGPPYAEIAVRLGLSEGAVKVAVHRMRQRYGQFLREAIGRTVSRTEEVDDELRYLIQVIGQ